VTSVGQPVSEISAQPRWASLGGQAQNSFAFPLNLVNGAQTRFRADGFWEPEGMGGVVAKESFCFWRLRAVRTRSGMNTIRAILGLQPLWLTLKVASVATLCAFMIGVALAFLLAKGKFHGREWLDAFLTLPLVLPPTVLGYYLIVLAGRNGWIGHWVYEAFGITLMFTWQGAAIAATIVSLPLVLKSSRTAFENVDANLEKAARTLGVSEMGVFFRVSFPLAWRGIFAGTMLAFARAMGEFGATLMVAGNLPGKTQTLSLAVYDAVQAGNDRLAGTLVLVISLVCIVILVSSGRMFKTQYLREMDR
jgi:molybdate transport system permease protein